MGAAMLSVGLIAGVARAQTFEVLQAFSAEGGNPRGSLLRTPDGRLYGTSAQGGFSGQGTVFVLTPDGSGGYTFATLHEFQGVDGATPYCNLILGMDGNLYGTTSRDGARGRGTVFQITPSGTLTTLHDFDYPEGSPHAGVIQDGETFYGTTQSEGAWGYGTVFRMSPSGSLTTLYSFFNGTDGRYPYAGLMKASDGNFYGTTQYGGGASDYGTIFKITPSGTLTTLHGFTASEGGHSEASLVQDSNGDLWGTTQDGNGTLGLGTVFKITLSGAMSVHDFLPGEGAYPHGSLIRGADGNFFGTTYGGGPNDRGTVFSITPLGYLTTLHAFGTGAGANPYAGVIQDTDGNLYGTTYSGSSAPGTVFQLTSSGTLNTLHSFARSDIKNPFSDLIQAGDGNFYGTTSSGGGPGAYGTVFRMAPSGDLTILHTFVYGDGAAPKAGLIQGTDGDLYGTTSYGGPNYNGTVFKITLSGSLTTLHSFSYSEGNPIGKLVQADGNFYGTTQSGGAGGYGTVFQITPSGTLTYLHSFAFGDGINPWSGLIRATDGKLYGTCPYGGPNSRGTVFSITLSGSLSVLHAFEGNGAGSYPRAGVIQATDGNFYGTTTGDGANGRGTFFQLTPSGGFATLHNFEWTEGDFLFNPLLQGRDGNFYGAAGAGGTIGLGTVFKVTPSGIVTVLHSFTGGSGGSLPAAGLMETADGDFLGTASSGTNVGEEGGGVIFRLSPCARPTAVASGTATICAGSSTGLTGSGGQNCAWSPGSGLSDANSCSTSANPSSTTTYTLTVTDASGCASTNRPTVTVTVNPPPTASVSGSGTICAGAPTTIQAVLTGTPPWSLTWSDGILQTGITSSPTTRDVNPSFTTTYTVLGVSDAHCSGTSSGSAVVTVNPRPTAVAIGSGPILFGGPGRKIYGFGGGAGQCSWSPTTELTGLDACSPTATPAATTTYTLTVTHPNGCASTNNPTVTVTVLTHVPTTTTLRSSPNPSNLGSSVTFTATVAAGTWTPRGTVTFMDGATPLGTLTLSGPPIAMATFSTSALSAGDHSITAVYGGQGVVFTPSTSDPLTQTVNLARVSFQPVSPTSSFYGDPVTLRVYLSVPPPAVITPTGNVMFRDGVVNLGTATLDGTGQASLTIPAPSTGLHPITVFYPGNTDILPGTSAVSTLRVTNSNACGTLQGPLTPSLATGTNTDPQGVATGDFDLDGRADLVSANFKSSSVSVFLSNGDGTFRPGAPYPVGTNPISVAVADFNGDDHPDLAVANAGSGNVSVLLNTGNGTFLPATAYGAGTAPQSVAVGDFNGDGIWDLVVSNQTSANVSVLLGNGDGTFRTPINSPAGTKPSGVVVGDFNGDHIADVVVANYDAAKISVLIGNGDGTFRAPVSYATLTGPVSVAAGYFDGSGYLDLAVANWGNSYISVLLGNGDGTFKAKKDYGAGSRPVSVVVGDFNGDGYADLAAGNANSDNVSILLGKGDGTFQADVLYPAGNQPHSIAVLDVYGNGKPGLVVANELTNDLSILPGACPTTTTVASSDISSDFGQSVTFTAHVTSASSGTPTGTVTFKDGTTVLGTATLASGSASFSTSLLCPGSHKITGVYSGDSNFKDGTSSALTQTVAPLAVTAPVVVCPGTGHPASVPDVPGARYVWTITNGTITSGSGTPAISWVAGMSGTVTLRVTVTTAPGCTATASKAVTNTAPSAVITAPAAVCAGSTGNSASVPSAGTGATYFWEIENGTITSGTVTNAIKFTAGSSGPAILHVTVTNANGCVTTGSKTVTVNPIPDAMITAVPAQVCPNSTGNHASVSSAGTGAHYTWTITNGTITAGAGTSSVTFSAKASGTVTLKVTVTNSGGCSSTTSRTVNIKTSC